MRYAWLCVCYCIGQVVGAFIMVRDAVRYAPEWRE